MEPPPAPRIAGTTALMPRKTPFTLTASIRSSWLALVCSMRRRA